MELSEKTKKAQLKLRFMKRTFPKTLFKWCSAFVLVGVLFSGCKKYDDDIVRLQESIDAHESAMSALDQLVKSGEVVNSVAQTANGVRSEERRVGKEWDSTCSSRGAPYP